MAIARFYIVLADTFCQDCQCGNFRLELQLVGYLRGYVFERDACARNALEPYAIERQARELTHFHLPLDQVVSMAVAVYAKQKELFSLLVVAAVVVEHLSYLPHHIIWIHGGSGFH